MVDATQIKEHMDVIGADGVHVGTVDDVEGDRIKLTKSHAGKHGEHHHFISLGLVAGIEGNTVRLSANADTAILFEEEEDDDDDMEEADTERLNDDDDDDDAADNIDASEDDDDEDTHENQAPSREIPERG